MKILWQLSTYAGIGVSGWLLGIRLNGEENIILKSMPGLPLLATVSAATPITRSPSEVYDHMGSKLSSPSTTRISQVSV